MMRRDPWGIQIQPTNSIPFDVLNHIYTLLRETFIEEGDDTLWSDMDWHILITISGEAGQSCGDCGARSLRKPRRDQARWDRWGDDLTRVARQGIGKGRVAKGKGIYV